MTIRPKQFARIGEFHLEEAVLDVLLAAKHKKECIGAADISRRAGIFRDKGDEKANNIKGMNDAIVTGFLVKLHAEKKVQRCDQPGGAGGWELTDAEFVKRRDDI